MTNNGTTCIIPFFNEGTRILRTLACITSIPIFDEIICVDDGSSDTIYKDISKLYPNIHVIRHEKNSGKVAAVSSGALHATHTTLFLLDADLESLNAQELQKTVEYYHTHQIDALILGRKSSNWFVHLTRGDILFSGQRIMHRDILIQTLEQNPAGYQLEIANNTILRKNNYTTAVLLCTSFTNTYKYKKWGIFGGWIREIHMVYDIIRYAGLREYIQQVCMFGKQSITL